MLDAVLSLRSMDDEIVIALRANLARLMAHFHLSQVELARKAGVAQKTISDINTFGKDGRAAKYPTIRTIAKLADAFDTSPWLLLKADVPLDLLLNRRVDRLIDTYFAIEERGRETVDRIAESEARYLTFGQQNQAQAGN